MRDVLINKRVKTKKVHRCWGCGRPFPKNTTLELIEAVDNGDFSRTYWCPVCVQVWNDGNYRDDIDMGGLQDDEFWEETRARIEEAI